MHPVFLHFGNLALPTYGIAVAVALIATLTLSSRAASRSGLDPQKIWNAGVIAVLTAFAGARLLLIAFHLRDFLAHPFWMLGLISLRGEGFVAGGLVMGICAAVGYLMASQQPLLSAFDCFAPAIFLGLAIQDAGCFFAGCGYGVPSRSPWAVTYSNRLASLWYGVPLGMPLHPVQIYRALLDAAVFTFLMLPAWRRLRTGEAAGIALFLGGLGQGLLMQFAAASAQEAALVESLAGIAVLAGGFLWLRPQQ